MIRPRSPDPEAVLAGARRRVEATEASRPSPGRCVDREADRWHSRMPGGWSTSGGSIGGHVIRSTSTSETSSPRRSATPPNPLSGSSRWSRPHAGTHIARPTTSAEELGTAGTDVRKAFRVDTCSQDKACVREPRLPALGLALMTSAPTLPWHGRRQRAACAAPDDVVHVDYRSRHVVRHGRSGDRQCRAVDCSGRARGEGQESRWRRRSRRRSAGFHLGLHPACLRSRFPRPSRWIRDRGSHRHASLAEHRRAHVGRAIRCSSRRDGLQQALVLSLREQGWPATSLTADGPRGPVTLVFVAADDARMPSLLQELEGSPPRPSGRSTAWARSMPVRSRRLAASPQVGRAMLRLPARRRWLRGRDRRHPPGHRRRWRIRRAGLTCLSQMRRFASSSRPSKNSDLLRENR